MAAPSAQSSSPSHTGGQVLTAALAGIAGGALAWLFLHSRERRAAASVAPAAGNATGQESLEPLRTECELLRQRAETAETNAADLEQRLQALVTKMPPRLTSSNNTSAAQPSVSANPYSATTASAAPPSKQVNPSASASASRSEPSTSAQPDNTTQQPTSAASASQSEPSTSAPTTPLLHVRPIGYLRSCFTTRNGTPRQPLLVETARSQLTLLPDVPDASLEGLSSWSHVWVLYWFHENTEPRVKAPVGDLHGVKGKVKVPRLNGEKVGLFATRTPHRPVPIGLSVANVLEVRGRTLILGGADIVDGSPVLDIKPYVPFCDAVPRAVAPPYVQAEAAEEPLSVGRVIVTPVGRQQLHYCWTRNRSRSLYDTAEAYEAFVCEVLSRDIRSTRQRLDVGAAAQRRNAASLASAAAVLSHTHAEASSSRKSSVTHADGANGALAEPSSSGGTHAGPSNSAGRSNGIQGNGTSSHSTVPVTAQQGTGTFHVVLEGVDVSYDIGDQSVDNAVIIGGASLTTALAMQHKHKHRH